MNIFLKALWDKPGRLVVFAAIIGTILIVLEIRDRGKEIKIQTKNTDAQIEAVGIQSKTHTTQVLSRAVEQLVSNQEIIRLRAVHSLERLAEDSEEYYWTIMQVLTLCCKEYDKVDRNTKIPSRYIQEILNVFKRRKYHYGVGEEKERTFDLSSTGLRSQNLREVNLSKANIQEVCLRNAQLQKAILYRADLEGANLQGANLQGANLQGANLQEANLQGANLEEAMLRNAILQKAENLTIKQLSRVKTLYGAILNPGLMKQVKEKYPHLLEEPKPDSSVSINNGAESTNSISVTLSFSSDDAVGVTGYYLSTILSTPLASNPDWVSVTPTINFNADVPYTLSSGDGVKTVYIWYKDAAGNVSNAYSDSINLITDSDDNGDPDSLDGPSVVPVTWIDAVGVTVNGNSITKTASAGWGNGGAASLESFTGDGGVEFVASAADASANGRPLCGLSSTNLDASRRTIEYSIYLRDNGSLIGIGVYENGVLKGSFGDYHVGDVFRVERVGSTIVYKKNRVTFYTSARPTDASLMVDSAIYNTGGEISDVNLIGVTDIGDE